MNKKIRFDDVGKITMGRRPTAPPMPIESTWVIETNYWSPVTVKLKGRIVVKCWLGFVGEPFERLTSTMICTMNGDTKYAKPFQFSIRMVEPQHESYGQDA